MGRGRNAAPTKGRTAWAGGKLLLYLQNGNGRRGGPGPAQGPRLQAEACGTRNGRREGSARSSSSERRGEPAVEEAVRHLLIALAQVNVTVGDLDGKAARIIGAML